MPNQIKVALTHSIITRYDRGWSQKRIARELGLDRETVTRHIRLEPEHAPKPAIPTAWSPKPKLAIPTARSGGRGSRCKPFHEQIERKLRKGLTARRIY
jgi:predicted transcriptional regulator